MLLSAFEKWAMHPLPPFFLSLLHLNLKNCKKGEGTDAQPCAIDLHGTAEKKALFSKLSGQKKEWVGWRRGGAVSYTHLTLPTRRTV